MNLYLLLTDRAGNYCVDDILRDAPINNPGTARLVRMWANQRANDTLKVEVVRGDTGEIVFEVPRNAARGHWLDRKPVISFRPVATVS